MVGQFAQGVLDMNPLPNSDAYAVGTHDYVIDIGCPSVNTASARNSIALGVGAIADAPDSIVLHTGVGPQMLKITPDGFYVRGVKVEQDSSEALKVYTEFRAFLAAVL